MEYVNELHRRITEVVMPDKPNWLTDFGYKELMIINSNYATKGEKRDAVRQLFFPPVDYYYRKLIAKDGRDAVIPLREQLDELHEVRHTAYTDAVILFQLEPLKLDEKTINDKQILIRGNGRVLIAAKQHDIITQSTLIKKEQSLSRLAKLFNVKLPNRNRLGRLIYNEYVDYDITITEYREVYNNLKEKCENYVFHKGTTFDPYFRQELIEAGEARLMHLLYKGKAIVQIETLNDQLDDLLENTDWKQINEIFI